MPPSILIGPIIYAPPPFPHSFPSSALVVFALFLGWSWFLLAQFASKRSLSFAFFFSQSHSLGKWCITMGRGGLKRPWWVRRMKAPHWTAMKSLSNTKKTISLLVQLNSTTKDQSATENRLSAHNKRKLTIHRYPLLHIFQSELLNILFVDDEE